MVRVFVAGSVTALTSFVSGGMADVKPLANSCRVGPRGGRAADRPTSTCRGSHRSDAHRRCRSEYLRTAWRGGRARRARRVRREGQQLLSSVMSRGGASPRYAAPRDQCEDGRNEKGDGGPSRGRHRQLDHEAGARLSVGAVFDPDLAPVQVHVPFHQGEAEAGAVAHAAPTAPRSPVEALEDQVAIGRRGRPGPASSTAMSTVSSPSSDARPRSAWRRRRSCAALSRRLAIDPASRRLSPRIAMPRSRRRRRSTGTSVVAGGRDGLVHELDDHHTSSSRRTAPASKREISSRSSTSCRNRVDVGRQQIEGGDSSAREARRGGSAVPRPSPTTS